METQKPNSALPPYDVFATVLAYGPNRPRVLADVLNLLKDGCQDQGERGRLAGAGSPGFNVSHAWVRSVGEIGVVLLRFETTEEGYRNLRRINTGVLENRSAKSRAPLVRLHRAMRPWHLDDRVRSVVLRYEGTSSQWANGKPGSDFGGERILDELLHNLAGDHRIDVAQVDMVRTKDTKANIVDGSPASWSYPARRQFLDEPVVVAALRLFDLGRRGQYFLQQSIDLAKHAILGPPPAGEGNAGAVNAPGLWPRVATAKEAGCSEKDQSLVHLEHPWFDVVWDSEEDKTVDKATRDYISHALRGPVEESDPGWESASVFVHALDISGLLAEVTYSVRRMNCRIDRVSCRGLGRDAVVLMTIGWQAGAMIPTSAGGGEPLTPLVVEQALRGNLKRFYERMSNSMRLAEYERGGSQPAGYWNIYVERNARPEVRDAPNTARLFVESPVFAVEDREWLLLGIVKSLGDLNGYLEDRGITRRATGNEDFQKGVSIYYLDLRPQAPGGKTESVIGFGVMIEAVDASKTESAQEHFTRWWKDEYEKLKLYRQ